MGLDMYLNKIKKFGNCTISDVRAVDNVFDLEQWNKDHPDEKCTLERWCGLKEPPAKEIMDFYIPLMKEQGTYYKWKSAIEQVAYWRKANQIFKWFEDNCADGHFENCSSVLVTKEQLEKLLRTCKMVLANSELVDGKVKNGKRMAVGLEGWEDIIEDGQVVEDKSIAQELLPTRSGFFFGSTEYDQYYIEDIQSTINQIMPIISDTDFDEYDIYFCADW